MSENNDYSYLLDIIKLAEASEEVPEDEKINLVFEGNFEGNNSTSKVNLNLSYLFSKDSTYNVSVFPETIFNLNSNYYEIINDNLAKKLDSLDISIRHNIGDSFALPEQGHWVVFKNWDFGSMPLAWNEAFSDYLDQLWVSSEYNKKCYIESGISENRIKVINSAVDTLFFNNQVEALNISTKKSFKFLYKGALDYKSGFDTLLKTYAQEFVNEEDVALVVLTTKDELTEESNVLIKSFTNNPSNPELIVIDMPEDLNEIAKIYKACNYLVYNYRVESYCTELVEAMACGVPAIVTNGGSSLDYCNKENSFLIDANKLYQEDKIIENIETKGQPSWFEIDPLDFRVKLRQAFELDEESYKEMSKNAYKNIINNFTWVKINDKIKDFLKELKSQPILRTTNHQVNLKILDALTEMNKGDFAKSEEKLKEASEINPNEHRVNFYLATLTLNRKSFEESLNYILKSIEREPNVDDKNNFLGVILYKLGEYAFAKKFFEKTLYLNPNYTGAKESIAAINSLPPESLKTESKLSEEKITLLNKFLEELKLSILPTVSVCILAKNEQKNIVRAIKSVKRIADEIIVLDTGSTDKTVELATKEGAKVFQTEWKDSFAVARNEAMSHATMDWILMLDSDEALSEDSSEKLKQTLVQLSNNKVYLTKITNILDKFGSNEKYEHYVVRVLPNHKNFTYIRNIHEYPVSTDGSLLNAENLKDIEILHYGYESRFIKEKNKIERNYLLLKELYDKEPSNPFNSFYLSENYKSQEDYENTLKYSLISVESAKKDPKETYLNIMTMSEVNVIEALIALSRNDEAKEKAKEYEKDVDNRPDYWLLLASIEYFSNNLDTAEKLYKKAFSLRSNTSLPALDLGSATWKPLAGLSRTYKDKGDLNTAVIYLKRAIKEFPSNMAMYYELISLYGALGNLENIERTIKTIITKINDKESIELLNSISNYYFEKDSYERFYKLLEAFRKLKTKDKDLVEFVETLVVLYNKVLVDKPELQAVKYSLAYCLNYLGKLDDSEALFNELFTKDDLEVDSLHNMASIAFSKNDIEKAEELYKKVLDIDEFHSETYLSLIKLELARNNIVKAEEYLKEVETIDPNNTELAQLKFQLARNKGNNKEASDIYASMLFHI